MKRYRGYLIDLDGTMYHGGNVIPDAVEFIHRLKKERIPFVFLTNNSTRTREDVAAAMNEMGIPTVPSEVLTSSDVTAMYLSGRFRHPRLYVIGEAGLRRVLERAGCQLTDGQDAGEVDAVVVGLDRQITYEKLSHAVRLIRHGALFVATNGDLLFPSECGFVPGNGALCAAVAAASGQQPLWMGKPEARMPDAALSTLGLQREDVLLIGDNLHTDIAAGVHAGIDTLLVLTGVTSETDAAKSEVRATYIARNLTEWMEG